MMQNRPARIILLLGGVIVMGILASLFSRGADQIQALKVGDPIPDLTLQGSDGKEHSLRKICAEGSGVIVAWIPKTGTPG